jgi:hypothetical protein
MIKKIFLTPFFILTIIFISGYFLLPSYDHGAMAFEAQLTSEVTSSPASVQRVSNDIKPSLMVDILSWAAAALTVLLIVYAYYHLIKFLTFKKRRNYKELELMR